MTSEKPTTPTMISPDIYVAETGTAKRRGVLAMRDFRPDEVVEACPVTAFPPSSGALPENLSARLFKLPDPFDPKKEWYMLSWGCATLYNHGNPANLRYSIDAEEKTITFRAGTAIRKNEELTIDDSSRDHAQQARDGRR